MRINVELHTQAGTTICESIVVEDNCHPAIIVVSQEGLPHKAFYKVSSHAKGTIGIYQECDAKTIAIK